MWFKNIRAYRLTSSFDLSPEQLGEKLAQRDFRPCAKSQAVSAGWVPPLGEESGELVHAAGGRMLLKLKREERLLPATVDMCGSMACNVLVSFIPLASNTVDLPRKLPISTIGPPGHCWAK